MPRARVLLLGGTTEAARLAEMLADDGRFAAILSLAGVTRAPRLPRIGCRIGGFGGVAGLSAWLRQEAIEAVVDATHPYAVQISRNAALAAAAVGLALLRIERPAWQEQPGDHWIRVRDAEAAASALGCVPRRVLLTVGAKSLAAFHAAPWHDYVVRCIDPPDPGLLPPAARLLLARGPFTLQSETALLAEHGIEILVSKNSGGAATAAKLVAARQAGLRVVMIERPDAQAAGASVQTPMEAMRWLSASIAGREQH